MPLEEHLEIARVKVSRRLLEAASDGSLNLSFNALRRTAAGSGVKLARHLSSTSLDCTNSTPSQIVETTGDVNASVQSVAPTEDVPESSEEQVKDSSSANVENLDTSKSNPSIPDLMSVLGRSTFRNLTDPDWTALEQAAGEDDDECDVESDVPRLRVNSVESVESVESVPPASRYSVASLPELDKVRDAVCAKHHSFLRGWRKELDPDGDLSCTFQDFCEAAKRVSFHEFDIDMTKLFNVCKGRTTLHLNDIDPNLCRWLCKLRKWVKETFDDPFDMFEQFDNTHDGQISFVEFGNALKRHGFKIHDEMLHVIFEGLDLDGGGLVSQDELILLEDDADERVQLNIVVKQKEEEEKVMMLKKQAEFNDRMTKGDGKASHRLACRAWHHTIFEIPGIVLQRRQARQHQAMMDNERDLHLFQQHLRSTCGHEIRAWRRLLDPRTTYRLTRNHLFQYCRNILFEGKASAIWTALNADLDDSICIEEFAPKDAQSLANFRKWAISQFGSSKALWKTAPFKSAEATLPTKRKVSCHDFIIACNALGCELTPSDLQRTTSRLDFDGVGYVRQDDCVWLDGWRPLEWLTAKPDKMARKKFRERLLKKYGSFAHAWRILLDADGTNRVSWKEFQEACRRLNFKQNIEGAWRALDEDLSGWISLNEIDSETHELLSSFKKWADQNFGSVARAFRVIDKDGSGGVTFSELRRTCKQLAWRGNTRALFDHLDVHKAGADEPCRSLKLSEIAFLDRYNQDVERSDHDGKRASEAKPKAMNHKQTHAALGDCSKADKALLQKLAHVLNQGDRLPVHNRPWSAASGACTSNKGKRRPISAPHVGRMMSSAKF